MTVQVHFGHRTDILRPLSYRTLFAMWVRCDGNSMIIIGYITTHYLSY